jgi:NlpC/P60 family putative phage cell wall peptidase
MSDLKSIRREAVVAHARRWIGTPYHHQASRLGVGADCIGLVRGVWRDLYGAEPEALPGYGRDWSEASGEETLLKASRRHLIEIAPQAVRPGDVLVFRYRARAAAKHVGVVGGTLCAANAPQHPPDARLTIIHAVEGAPVSEVALIGWWRRRVAAAFSFPGIID